MTDNTLMTQNGTIRSYVIARPWVGHAEVGTSEVGLSSECMRGERCDRLLCSAHAAFISAMRG